MDRYGDVWRRMRRAAHEALNKRRAAEFYPIQSKEAVILTEGLLLNASNWETEMRRTSASTMLSALYDLPTILSSSDPTVVKINEFTNSLAKAASPGAHMVEFFTWMKYLPSCIAPWKRKAEEGYREFSNTFLEMFHGVENRINQGCDRPSFAGTLVRERQRHGLNETEAAWLAATMYAAGSETSGTAMTWFILAMIAYPEKQRKCQEELDMVVGRSRMPRFEDREHLPYLQAVIRELIRWRTTTPVGLQHVAMKDDWYQGYFIPKGTMCLANIWSLNRDRSVYGEDADDFNPDRFIDEKGQLCPPLQDTKEEGHVSFGYGPRICLGRHMAHNSLFINIASILWATNITPMKDDAGNAIVPNTLETINAGVVACPLPFGCSITPRFPEAMSVVSYTRELF